jgi:quercetin dioxygenase-like cupin family protein
MQATHGFLTQTEAGQTQVCSWGRLHWLCNDAISPGSEATIGLVYIDPGQENPRHSHPNCEEYLYVLSGQCDHWIEDQCYQLQPGSLLRVPRGQSHWAHNTGWETLRMLLSYSSGVRQTDMAE